MKSIDLKGSAFTYEYTTDGKRNLTKAISAENVIYSFEYDAYGNAKKATVGSGTTFMVSDAAYTASGNYVQTVTDISGNVVTYSYDETKGNLSSVTRTRRILPPPTPTIRTPMPAPVSQRALKDSIPTPISMTG